MTEPRNIPDPLSYFVPLPIVRTFFPMGFALELSTDSPEVAAMAASLWSRYPKLSDLAPVQLRISASPRDAVIPPKPTASRGQGHLFCVIHGGENFAVVDLAGGFAFACLTRDVAANHPYTIHHFLEPVSYMLLAANRLTILHAACVSLGGKAILLGGDSGAGKTCLSYACAARGWTFISGDATGLVRGTNDGTVVGRPYTIRFRDSARALFPELARYPARDGLNGKLDIEPPVDDLKITTGLEAQATHLVFLRRSSGYAGAALESVSSAEAFRRLDRLLLFGDEEIHAVHQGTLLRFLETRPALELSYSTFGDAERVLRSLVDTDRGDTGGL